jgi:hypothetical protein
VSQENETTFEPDNQILAATGHRSDALTLDLRRHLGGLIRSREPRVPDVDGSEHASEEGGFEPRPYGLDLG